MIHLGHEILRRGCWRLWKNAEKQHFINRF